ncbi:MAG TPA: CDP-archaeol synthase [Xanthobacteraceae bacterium]|nr:CDP-archaeol synthase [Xanthobacteraceae bacterium]
MHPDLIVTLLILLTAANGSPVIAKRVLGERFAWPIDGGLALRDGRPLFGTSKTWRGLAAAVLATTVVAPLVGLTWQAGFAIGAAAMAGDLLSSFLKRRLGLKSSSQALGLDQVPESLLPQLVVARTLGLTIPDMLGVTLLFFAGELIVSRVLFALHVRDRPY